jgi:hypothetical protein
VLYGSESPDAHESDKVFGTLTHQRGDAVPRTNTEARKRRCDPLGLFAQVSICDIGRFEICPYDLVC